MVAGVETGGLIDGRYRLDGDPGEAAGRPIPATDTVLDRRVGVRVVPGLTKTAAAALTAAAGRAGQVADARWIRILDLGTSADTDRKVVLWIVTEWVEAPTLTESVRREPMRPATAAAFVMACAQAVAAAHRAGAGHGALQPDDVVVAADGQPRIAGLELDRALDTATGRPNGPSLDPPEASDTRRLGALLFAALTGCWPVAGWHGLPPPRRGDGLHPRQQRRGVPRDLDEITATALSGGYSGPEAMLRALATVSLTPAPTDPDDPDRPRRNQVGRIAWWVVPPLLVAGVGLVAWIAGRDLGQVPGADRTTPTLSQPHVTKGEVGTRSVWTKPPAVTSFDPNGDGSEDPGGVGLAVDSDPSTAWSTDTYHGNAHFGGLKPGVGLLIDLGRAKRVDAARLLLTAAGADVELRAGSVRPQQATDLPVVAHLADAPQSARLQLRTPTRARYWLLWITSLPKSGNDDYSVGVAEIKLLH